MKCLVLILVLLLSSAFAVHAEDWSVVSNGGSKKIRKGERDVRVWVKEFRETDVKMKIIDQGNSAKERTYESLRDAMERNPGIVGCNGGYFQKDFRPLGLTICDGVRIGTFHKSSLLSGVLFSREGKIRIVRRESFQDDRKIDQLLQAGPMLIEDGREVEGLQTSKQRARTVIFTDEGGRWAVAVIRNASLLEAAEMLAQPGLLADWQAKTALNLDGGTSSGIWMKSAKGKVIYSPEWKGVRNFLAFFPK